MLDLELVRGKMGVEIKGDYYNAHPLPFDANIMFKDEAYISGDIVMPYYGEVEKINEKKPGYYGIRDNDVLKILTVIPEPEEKKDYSIDKIINFELEKLLENINEEDFLSPEEIEMINMSSDFRLFEINDDDDFLKKIVKTIINSKKVNLKIYANRLPERHHLGNMISSLSGKTKMSVAYFKIWSEILGFDFKIAVSDNGSDTIVPLKHDVNYDSVSNDIEEI